jgi:flagellar hook-basal body complex protein FliE
MTGGAVSGAGRAGQAEAKADFAKMLKTYVNEVDGKQQASYSAVKDLVAGRTQDILPVVNAVAQADVSFKLLMGVRNKVIEAYKQTMNMQV